MLLQLPESEWDLDLAEEVHCFFGNSAVTVYEANVGYKAVAEGGAVLFLGEDDGSGGTAFYLNRASGEGDEIYIALAPGVDKECRPTEYKSLISGLNPYSKQEVLSYLETYLRNRNFRSHFDKEKALCAIVDVVAGSEESFDCITDVIIEMDERNLYPFCIQKQVIWLN